MKQNVNDLKDEIWLDWHQNFCIEVTVQTMDEFVKQTGYLSIKGWSVCLGHNRADKHAVCIFEKFATEGHRVAIGDVDTCIGHEHKLHLSHLNTPIGCPDVESTGNWRQA